MYSGFPVSIRVRCNAPVSVRVRGGVRVSSVVTPHPSVFLTRSVTYSGSLGDCGDKVGRPSQPFWAEWCSLSSDLKGCGKVTVRHPLEGLRRNKPELSCSDV